MYKRYDYECPKCGFGDEFFCREDETPECPECHTSLRRLPSVPAVIGVTESLTRGRHTLESQFPGKDGQNQLQIVVEGARRHGYEPKATDNYYSSFARFPGDPRAFGPSSDPDGYIQHMSNKLNVPVYGIKSYKPKR